MTNDARRSLQKIIDFCTHKWIEAEHDDLPGFNTPDNRTGRKMAYNDVKHYVRALLDETAEHAQDAPRAQ